MVEVSAFLENFKNAVDFQNPADIKPETSLGALPEWDSLAALGTIVMFDMEYGVTITGDDLKKASTINDLFVLLQQNSKH
jgi:acyl carrier protein